MLDKENFILYAPEILANAFNYSDWDKFNDLINKHADPNLITTLRAWNGMQMKGSFKKLLESKPDVKMWQCDRSKSII